MRSDSQNILPLQLSAALSKSRYMDFLLVTLSLSKGLVSKSLPDKKANAEILRLHGACPELVEWVPQGSARLREQNDMIHFLADALLSKI